jgi:hypothetical protein
VLLAAIAAGAAACVAVPGAVAGPRASLSLVVVPTPVASGRPLVLVVTGVSPVGEATLRVVERTSTAAPAAACAPTYERDRGGSGFGRNHIRAGRFAFRGRLAPIVAPGRYRVCAWLADGLRTVRLTSAFVAVRPPRASVIASADPAVVPVDVPFTLRLQTTTEFRGMVGYMHLHPSGVACGATSAADTGGVEIPEQALPAGTGTVAAAASSVSTPGQYVVCVWVGRRPDEALATATAPLTVVPAG